MEEEELGKVLIQYFIRQQSKNFSELSSLSLRDQKPLFLPVFIANGILVSFSET